MKTTIKEFNLNTGEIEKEAIYILPAKKALISYLQQRNGNYNTWTYPEDMEGIRKSIRPNTLLYQVNDSIVIYATENK